MSMMRSQMKMVVQSMMSWSRSVTSWAGQQQDCLTADEMPGLLREPFIFTGYRPLHKPWAYYLQSVCQLHNETLNVWTHAVGFVLILLSLLYLLRDFDVAHDKVAWPVLTFGICCLMSVVLSTTAHLLHSKSLWHHFVMFLLDYAGVTFYTFGTGVAGMFTCSSKVFHDVIHPYFLTLNVLFSWFAFFACCMAKLKLSHNNCKRKTLMITGVLFQAMFIAVPVLARYAECLSVSACRLSDLNHITLVFLLVLLCGVTFMAHAPERWLPGRCDIYGQGHQIFHVVSVLTMLAQFRALFIEVHQVKVAEQLNPNLWNMMLAFVVLGVAEFVTLAYFARGVVFRRCSQDAGEKKER